ncbi:MAG: UPF0175 family protein [Vulcanimicrobiota bacterium]
MLKLPDEILRLAGKGDSELPSYISALVVLDLFRQRSISAGKAAEVLGLDRQGFMDIADEHGIPLVNLTGSEAAEEWEAWRAHKERD